MACLLWILGFELAPNVHLALHEAIGHHHHADDGIAHSYLALGEAEEHGDDHGHDRGHDHGHDHDVDHDHGHDHDVEAGHHHDEPAAHHHEHGEADHHEHGDAADHDAHEADADEDVVVLLKTSDPADEVACFESNGHGRHAVAHRGLAVLATPPAWPPLASAPASGTTLRLLPAQPPRSLQPRHVRARGPPTATA